VPEGGQALVVSAMLPAQGAAGGLGRDFARAADRSGQDRGGRAVELVVR